MSIRSVAALVRAHNLLGIALIAMASALWSQHWAGAGDRVLAFIAGCVLVAAGGYSFNDLRDVQSDRIAHPSRPLVTGAISSSSARVVSLVATILGILVLVLLDRIFLLFAPLTALSLVVYSLGLKDRFGFLGNVLTAALVAAIPLLAGLSASDVSSILPLALVGFGLTLSREILKDIEDQRADARNGRRTLATGGHIALAKLFVVMAVLLAVLSGWLLAGRLSAAERPAGLVSFALGLFVLIMTIYWLIRPVRVHPTQQVIKGVMFGYAALFLVLAVLR